VGFPQSGDGLEIKILQQLFTEDEAALFLDMTPLLESPDQVAQRLDRDTDEIAGELEQMARKGLLFRRRSEEGVSYAAVPYVVGLFEFQVGRMGRDFARVHEAYYQSTCRKVVQSFQTPVMRTIPIQRTLVADSPVAPYEDVLGIIDAQDRMAIAPCVCRKTRDLIDEPCDRSLENCFSLLPSIGTVASDAGCA
jgi:hypothetical protein